MTKDYFGATPKPTHEMCALVRKSVGSLASPLAQEERMKVRGPSELALE
jgi:hypothetical protein